MNEKTANRLAERLVQELDGIAADAERFVDEGAVREQTIQRARALARHCRRLRDAIRREGTVRGKLPVGMMVDLTRQMRDMTADEVEFLEGLQSEAN